MNTILSLSARVGLLGVFVYSTHAVFRTMEQAASYVIALQ